MGRNRVATLKRVKCKGCGDSFEHLFRIHDDASVKCPRCDGEAEAIAPADRTYWRPFTPHYSHSLDRYFYSRSEEKDYAKKNGLVNISGDFGKRMAERKSPKEVSRERYLNKLRYK